MRRDADPSFVNHSLLLGIEARCPLWAHRRRWRSSKAVVRFIGTDDRQCRFLLAKSGWAAFNDSAMLGCDIDKSSGSRR